jgi:hypothetical protein
MPARRKRRVRRVVRNKEKRNPKRLRIIFILAFIAITITLFLRFDRRYWNGEDKLALVIQADSGGLIVANFDPSLGEITTVDIPAEAQLSVSRQLGDWKASSLWSLGEDKGLGGKLLSESVLRYFHFPVYLWAGKGAEGLLSTNPISITKAAIYPVKTNLSFMDRLSLAVFALRIPNSRRVDIPLKDTPYLRKTTLPDGSVGYKKTQSMPNSLLAVFSDSVLADSEYRASIIDETGENGVASDTGDILSILGAKLALVKKGEEEDYDCSVASSDEKVAEKIAQVFSCKEQSTLSQDSNVIEMRIGKGFADRF